MALKLDNEFGEILSGAGCRPQFANLVRYQKKYEASQNDFPVALIIKSVHLEIGESPNDIDPTLRAEINECGVACYFRIANEHFKTDTFKPDGGNWEPQSDKCVIQFMLSSNTCIFTKVVMMTSPQEPIYGYAKFQLATTGEGEYELVGEVKESEYMTPHDEILGTLTLSFTVTPNFALSLTKLENQYDTKNLPALMNVVSQESKTLVHRMGTFQSAIQMLQNIVVELQKEGAFGLITSKQLSMILNQASSAQGIELFEDLLWDIAKLSFAEHIFEPSLTFFPSWAPETDSNVDTGDIFEGVHPYSFALHVDLQDPVVLATDTEADFLRWTVALRIACEANAETNPERLKRLIVPDFCKDLSHPDKPTAGWLYRKKANRKALSKDYVCRFFLLSTNEEHKYTLSYSHDPLIDPKLFTPVPLLEKTELLVPKTLSTPSPFVLSINVMKVSDPSYFDKVDELCVVAQLSNHRQYTMKINPQKTTEFDSVLLLPVEMDLLPHANESVTTVNIGWFGEEVLLPPCSEEEPTLRFFVGKNERVGMNTSLCRASLDFKSVPFGQPQEHTLPLMGAEGVELTISITMRRLGQYKTAWPAVKTRVIQQPTPHESEQDKWEGSCMVRAAPQGLEIYNTEVQPDNDAAGDPKKPVAVMDYYAIESITAINGSTLDITIIYEDKVGGRGSSSGTAASFESFTRKQQLEEFISTKSMLNVKSKLLSLNSSVSPSRRQSTGMRQTTTFGMVTTKGKSISPERRRGGSSVSPSVTPDRRGSTNSTTPNAAGKDEGVTGNNYCILRVCPCPAETLKDLIRERKWMFRDRSMLLYIMHKLSGKKTEDRSEEDLDTRILEKLAIGSGEAYRHICMNMGEIIKTANWKHARAVGFTREHIRMFFRLQRLTCYFAKLVENRVMPAWAIEQPVNPREFARADLDKIFSSQYVQAGTFGAEAQGIENTVKGVGHVLKSLHRRMDEVKLYYHDSTKDMEDTAAIFFQEYYLRCIGELGAHIISDDVLQEVPIEVVVAFVCFLVKRDKSFHELLIDNAFEPDRNAFLTTILSIESMIRRLTKRTELEIVAQWPQDGDIGEDSSPYVASLLGDCSPDELGKMSTRAPEALMQLLEKYVPLISSQCKARGTLGAKIFEGMFFALPSYASNAANTIAKLNHSSCAWNAVRYLSAILNDVTFAGENMKALIEDNAEHLQGIPIDFTTIQAGIYSSGVEVSCILTDVALAQMDDMCADFFQAEWYSDDDNAVMRKACKLLCRKMGEVEGMVHGDPFFQHCVEAGVEKIAFRYLLNFIHRCTDQSGGKMLSQNEMDKMSADIDTMEQFLRKFGPSVLTSVYHLKEVLKMLTEPPEILLQVIFVDILKRHKGKEEYVFKLLKITAAVRDDLRSFFVPSWLNKLKQKMTAIIAERNALCEDQEGRSTEVTFDVMEWAFTADMTNEQTGAYIYTYLQSCIRNSRQGAITASSS